MAPRRFDWSAAGKRISKLERRTLRLHTAVSSGKTLTALDRGDKATLERIRGGRGGV